MYVMYVCMYCCVESSCMELMYSVSFCPVGPAIEDIPVNQVEERKEHASWDLLLSCS